MADITVNATQVRPLLGSITVQGDATVAMAVGTLVYRTGTTWDKANATAAATNDGQLGIVVAGARANTAGTIIAGERITVLIFGRVELGQGAVLDDDTVYYSSVNAGLIADATATHARIIGHMLTPTTLMFNPPVAVPA